MKSTANAYLYEYTYMNFDQVTDNNYRSYIRCLSVLK